MFALPNYNGTTNNKDYGGSHESSLAHVISTSVMTGAHTSPALTPRQVNSESDQP